MANQTATSIITVTGYFESHAKAEDAVSALKDAGFTANQIGIVASSSQPQAPVSSATGSTASSTTSSVGNKAEGMWSKVKNFFEGGDVEPYADEAKRGELASREVTPSGDDRFDYSHEDLRGSLQGLSVPEEQSRYFGHRFGQGEQGAVVTVTAPGRQEEAAEILEEYGADLGEGAADYQYPAAAATAIPQHQHVQLFGEVLRVHKDRINTGEVRIRKEVITETQTIQVPVTREELVVERMPVSGVQAAPGAVIGEATEIRIPLTEERASVEKQAVVREEVRVGKREIANVESLDEKVRHEELVVEDESKTKNR